MKKCVAKFLRIAFEISFFHFGCCNLPFLYFSFWFLPVKTLKKYSEYSEHLFEYSNIIRLFKMGRIRIRIVLFGKKYSNIRIIRIFVSTLVQTYRTLSYHRFSYTHINTSHYLKGLRSINETSSVSTITQNY